ncbi:hypothetical protein [Cypionkella sp.]|uniref:hypothetical protein n=1 Tax=Cypionkella sp. TaxID=2811411 RepID=UPI002AB8E9B3|nr:hypothetical protein [Cypionkella sp.]MDZ4396017.1 hypothetical protein [Cypionkella sp.]
MKRLMLTGAIALIGSTLQAQTVVGKALVDGKEVELFSNETWRFTVETAPDCITITPKLTFCGNPAHWKPSPPPAPIVAAAYQFNGTTYGQVVIEDVGTDLGLTVETARASVLQGVKITAKSEPTVMLVETTDFQGQPAQTVVYQVKLGAMTVVYANTMFLGKATLAQIMTYEIGSDYTDSHKAAHAEFLAATQVKEPDNG